MREEAGQPCVFQLSASQASPARAQQSPGRGLSEDVLRFVVRGPTRARANEVYGGVAQLGGYLLCKHAFISPKSLNRRLLSVQNPLLVGLLIGLHKLKGSLSDFGQTL